MNHITPSGLIKLREALEKLKQETEPFAFWSFKQENPETGIETHCFAGFLPKWYSQEWKFNGGYPVFQKTEIRRFVQPRDHLMEFFEISMNLAYYIFYPAGITNFTDTCLERKSMLMATTKEKYIESVEQMLEDLVTHGFVGELEKC